MKLIQTIKKNKKDVILSTLGIILMLGALIGMFYGIYRLQNSEEIHAKEDLTSLVDSNIDKTSSVEELFEYTHIEEEQRYLINDTSIDYIQTDIINIHNKVSIFISYDDDNRNLKGIVINRIDFIYSNYQTRTKTYITLRYDNYIYNDNDIQDITDLLESVRSTDVIELINELD